MQYSWWSWLRVIQSPRTLTLILSIGDYIEILQTAVSKQWCCMTFMHDAENNSAVKGTYL